MIIGLTGKNASGKGEAANYLKSKGFVYYSLSDVIREEATKRGIGHSRDNLINLGNELRKKFGPDYLAKQINIKIKQQLKKKKNFVIDSIRSPHEAKELIKNKGIVPPAVPARDNLAPGVVVPMPILPCPLPLISIWLALVAWVEP